MGEDGAPYLLESNIAPQLGDPQAMEDLRAKLALPMINTIPKVVLGVLMGGEYECIGLAEEPWSSWDLVSLVPNTVTAPE